jgi:hypothetical protein
VTFVRKYKRFSAKASLLLEKDKPGNAPDVTALFSFCLLLSWFGAAGIFVLQGYPIYKFPRSIEVNSLFLAAVAINLSLIVWSVNSLLFAGMGMGTIVFLLFFLRSGGELIFSVLGFLLAFSLVLSLTLLLLWFQLSKSRMWGCRVLLSTQVALLTLSLLFLVNYRGLAATPGGMTLALVVVALLVTPVLIAVTVWFRQKQDEQLTGKIYWTAFTIQLIAVIGAVFYYAVSPTVEHLGRPVEVREIRLADAALSRPLVEEGAAYLVSGDGRLYELHEVNLLTGRKQTLARISLPEPAEIGYPGYIEGCFLTAGSPARMTPDKLAFRFVCSLWGDADKKEVNLTLIVTVNQETGQTSWQVTGFTNRPEDRPAETAEYAGVTLYPIGYDFYLPVLHPHVRIAGAGIETKVFPKGSVLWTYAGQGWLLAGTNNGVFYAVNARIAASY